jgi:hypothetical protein
MKKLFQFAVVMLVIAICFSPMALAQQKVHSHMMVVPKPHSQVHPDTALPPTPGLYAVSWGFVGTPYDSSQNAHGWLNNTDGYELYPCFGNSTNSSNPQGGGPNLDCQYVGDPQLALQSSGGVFGIPSYTWPLLTSTTYGVTAYGCDGDKNGTQNPYLQGETWDPAAIDGYYIPCGQMNTWYEDWSGDSTDEILWSAEVTQGTTVIADSGTQDWGPNGYAAISTPIDAVFYQDFNFGDLGVTGVNNGNCVPNNGYPFTTNTPVAADYPAIIAAGKKCGEPKTGIATIAVTIEVAKVAYTKSTKTSVCGAQGTPCYTAKYTQACPACKASFKWDIYLQ